MINEKDYCYLTNLKNTDPKTYDIISEYLNKHRKELSICSHNIKNYISFIQSSHQIISQRHPEVKEYEFWNEMYEAVSELNKFMDLTSIYRYCDTATLSQLNLKNLLFSLPDELDNYYDTERFYSFDIDTADLLITADEQKLKFALIEILKNAFEATNDGDTISISAKKDTEQKYVVITITNQNTSISSTISDNPGNKEVSYISDDELNKLCTPFFTTKADHNGLGLSIVKKVCLTHNARLRLRQHANQTEFQLLIPLS